MYSVEKTNGHIRSFVDAELLDFDRNPREKRLEIDKSVFGDMKDVKDLGMMKIEDDDGWKWKYVSESTIK